MYEIRPEWGNLGRCISDRIHDEWAGLTGRDRADCNHAQQDHCRGRFGKD